MRLLHARRVTLAPVDGRNARELWEVLNGPDLRKFQDIPRVRPEEFERQVRTRPRHLRGGATGRFEWLLKAGDPPAAIGWISLRVNDRTPRIGEVGYSLLLNARGKGYASEALGAVIDEAFESADLDEVLALSDRVLVLHRGRLLEVGARGVSREAASKASASLKQNAASAFGSGFF